MHRETNPNRCYFGQMVVPTEMGFVAHYRYIQKLLPPLPIVQTWLVNYFISYWRLLLRVRMSRTTVLNIFNMHTSHTYYSMGIVSQGIHTVFLQLYDSTLWFFSISEPCTNRCCTAKAWPGRKKPFGNWRMLWCPDSLTHWNRYSSNLCNNDNLIL